MNIPRYRAIRYALPVALLLALSVAAGAQTGARSTSAARRIRTRRDGSRGRYRRRT
ncbi:MAG TPA: hypothetical protein VNO14_16445 [Blastocatellia bacterium]|nr:hypothetical protein [Blastocatellia bacterium]